MIFTGLRQRRSRSSPTAARGGALFLTASLIALAYCTVSLTPKIDQSFFFGDQDPQLREDAKIHRLFPRQDQLIINIEGDIPSASYLNKVGRLTRALLSIPDVISVRSLTHGPASFDEALKSSFWRRLLIAEDRRSSNVLVALDMQSPGEVIPKIEAAVYESQANDFRPVIAGVPYMIEVLRRNLTRDLKVFSLGAVVVFGLMIFVIFRSASILIGALAAGGAATALALVINHHINVEIGILTANLVTIVFVLTIPHVVYLTYNWKRLSLDRSTRDSNVREAFRETLQGSIWSTATTLLGFLSLLLVEAKPLRQLGASGSIGTLCALGAAYLIYPPFLLGLKQHSRTARIEGRSGRWHAVLARYSAWIAAGATGACLISAIGIFRLDTDPTLLSYFPEELKRGLERVDRTGGSSILEIVIRDARGAKLDGNEAYKRLWNLQSRLEQDSEVGSVISLPVLMAEGEKFPFSFLLSWNTILNKMAEPRYERIARQFVTTDHVYGHYILRMKESARRLPRHDVIERIRAAVRRDGFTPVLVGGMYALEAQLSDLVQSSLVQGLSEIVLLLAVIGVIVTRSVWVGLTMAFGMALVPLGLLGLIGWLKAPLDIISAPAASLTLGMGIDDTMIHLASRWKKLVNAGRPPNEAWNEARRHLLGPILVSMAIVCVGFSIFILSEFPPTRRFGLWVVLGTLMVLPITICFVPTVASLWSSKRTKS